MKNQKDYDQQRILGDEILLKKIQPVNELMPVYRPGRDKLTGKASKIRTGMNGFFAAFLSRLVLFPATYK